MLFIDILDEGVAKVFDRNHKGVFGGGRGNGMGEAEFFGFSDALIGSKHGADFPAEANFAKNYKIFG